METIVSSKGVFKERFRQQRADDSALHPSVFQFLIQFPLVSNFSFIPKSGILTLDFDSDGI